MTARNLQVFMEGENKKQKKKIKKETNIPELTFDGVEDEVKAVLAGKD